MIETSCFAGHLQFFLAELFISHEQSRVIHKYFLTNQLHILNLQMFSFVPVFCYITTIGLY